MKGIEIISRPHYASLPWQGEELKHRLQALLQDLKQGLEVSLSTLSVAMSSPRSYLFFAVHTSSEGEFELAGYAELLEWKSATGTAGYVENVVVSARFQGQGVGKSLMAKLLEVVQEQSIETVWLHSGAWRTQAQGLYRGLGFSEKDTVVLFKKIEGAQK